MKQNSVKDLENSINGATTLDDIPHIMNLWQELNGKLAKNIPVDKSDNTELQNLMGYHPKIEKKTTELAYAELTKLKTDIETYPSKKIEEIENNLTNLETQLNNLQNQPEVISSENFNKITTSLKSYKYATTQLESLNIEKTLEEISLTNSDTTTNLKDIERKISNMMKDSDLIEVINKDQLSTIIQGCISLREDIELLLKEDRDPNIKLLQNPGKLNENEIQNIENAIKSLKSDLEKLKLKKIINGQSFEHLKIYDEISQNLKIYDKAINYRKSNIQQSQSTPQDTQQSLSNNKTSDSNPETYDKKISALNEKIQQIQTQEDLDKAQKDYNTLSKELKKKTNISNKYTDKDLKEYQSSLNNMAFALRKKKKEIERSLKKKESITDSTK